jgi:hypothetical protein
LSKRGNSSIRQSLPAGRQGRTGGILKIDAVTILRIFANDFLFDRGYYLNIMVFRNLNGGGEKTS